MNNLHRFTLMGDLSSCYLCKLNSKNVAAVKTHIFAQLLLH